jgi:hypothetical protein
MSRSDVCLARVDWRCSQEWPIPNEYMEHSVTRHPAHLNRKNGAVPSLAGFLPEITLTYGTIRLIASISSTFWGAQPGYHMYICQISNYDRFEVLVFGDDRYHPWRRSLPWSRLGSQCSGDKVSLTRYDTCHLM